LGYNKLSIKDAVNYIEQGRMYLPEIQRKFVWSDEQIQNLFDSLLLGYPIGALLFWKTNKKTINDIDNTLNLYEFIRDYHERDRKDNTKVPSISSDFESYYIVLDGQQRLSSLYIAIKGSVSRKIHHRRWNNIRAFPKKELYMNLFINVTKKILDDDQNKRFKFLTEKEYSENQKQWFKVKDIFRYDNEEAWSAFCNRYYESKIPRENILALYKTITSKDIYPLSFYEINEADYDDVLNIFVRVNSSGTPLSKTDLLFSTIVSQWKGGRDEIDNLIKEMNMLGNKFAFGTDFIMRACLCLTDAPINLKITSFKKENVLNIKDNWERIKKALLDVVSFLEKSGFSDETIISYNALMPIAYYLYKGGELNSNNILEFKKYFIIAQIKNVFGVASNTAISKTREAIQNIKNFKKERFSVDLFKDVRLTGDTNFLINEDVINKCFEYDKGPYTFMLLTLLYPEIKVEVMEFHQDHVHPYSGFENKNIKGKGFSKETIERWRTLRNKLPNLQLLEGSENESKNDSTLTKWISLGNIVKYMPKGISYDLKDFDSFYKERKELMKAKLKAVLGFNNNS